MGVKKTIPRRKKAETRRAPHVTISRADSRFDAARAVYIHIPFCKAKCYYCDFVSFPGYEALHQDYVEALITEISRAEPRGPIESIYFGGGTPTVLSDEQLSGILRAVFNQFVVEPDGEITVEANPGTVDTQKLRNLRRSGFSRLSLGIQAFDDETLARLGRIHSAAQALEAYHDTRKAGFQNISIDLMYGLPAQRLEDWRKTLDQAVRMGPEHASLYELSIEEGTKFAEMHKTGELEIPDEDARLEMYEAAIEALTGAGYEHYEVSNFARPNCRSRHNQVYWRNEDYYGFGAGAARYLDGLRCTMTKSVARYISDVRQGIDPVESCERLTGRALMGETIMLALRTSDGVDLKEFEHRFGLGLLEVYGKVVKSLREDGLIELTGQEVNSCPTERMRLTHSGLLLANRVGAEFVEAPAQH